MKKSTKIVSLAATALMTVAPMISTAAPAMIAHADTISATQTKGTPYVYNKKTNSAVSQGNITLGKGENKVSSIIAKIKSAYGVKTGEAGVSADWMDIEGNVKTSLEQDNGIKVNADGSFDGSVNPLKLVLTARASNGKLSAPFVVYVKSYVAPTDYSMNPVISYNGKTYNYSQEIEVADNAGFNHVDLGKSVDVAAIQKAFTAKMSGTDNTGLSVSVDTSKVNTTVVGTYPVTVTATNANGYKTELTFKLNVGAKDAVYKTVQTGNKDVTAPIYTMYGNVLTATGKSLKDGDKTPTFKAYIINGKSYTKIGDNEYVETKFVDGSLAPKPVVETGKEFTVMHSSMVYDKNGKASGTVLPSYSTVTIIPDKITVIGGKTYYKMPNQDKYVRVTNITGTKRVLRHNAYVYRSSYRRADRRVLREGSTVITYGGSYKFKNGKTYYRIGGPRKQYVKVANF